MNFKIGDFFKTVKKVGQRMTVFNLLYIFVFLNVWDFMVNRAFFNGMIIGFLIFSPVTFLWFLARFRAIVLLTLISLFEFMVLLVFVLEGFELGGSLSVKSIFWIPFLFIAGINLVVGLNIYSQTKEKLKDIPI